MFLTNKGYNVSGHSAINLHKLTLLIKNFIVSIANLQEQHETKSEYALIIAFTSWLAPERAT